MRCLTSGLLFCIIKGAKFAGSNGSGGMTFEEAVRIEQEAHAMDKLRREQHEERRRRRGLLLKGEKLSKEEMEARMWAFMCVPISQHRRHPGTDAYNFPPGTTSRQIQTWKTTLIPPMTTPQTGSTMRKMMELRANRSSNLTLRTTLQASFVSTKARPTLATAPSMNPGTVTDRTSGGCRVNLIHHGRPLADQLETASPPRYELQ